MCAAAIHEPDSAHTEACYTWPMISPLGDFHERSKRDLNTITVASLGLDLLEPHQHGAMDRHIILPIEWPPMPRSFAEELSLISSQLVSLVDSNSGQALLGGANGCLLEDDLEGLRNVLDNGCVRRGVALLLTCVHGASRCAKFLISQGAMQDLDMAVYGEPACSLIPITVAAVLCHWEVVNVLVEGGAEAHAFDKMGLSALSIAAHHHPKGNLEALLSVEAVCRHINASDPQGFFPLKRASASAVPLLVKAGADVDLFPSTIALEVWDYAFTALHHACQLGCVEKVKALVECGADVGLEGPDELTPLMWAAKCGRVEVVEYLLSTPGLDIDVEVCYGYRAVDYACNSGHLELVKRLVAAGSRVDPQDWDEHWPLASAASGGNLEVVKYLVEEAGANEWYSDPKGSTALLRAARDGRVEVVEYLLGRPGMEAHVKTADGSRAISLACHNGHLEVVRLLVAAGARVNTTACDETWPWPLDSAALGGKLQVVKYLVEEAGADTQHADSAGWMPLMRAANKGHADVVEYLLGRSDTYIDAQTTEGTRAINYACSRGYLEVVKLLVGAGSRIYAEASDEAGILSSTAAAGKLEVVKYLVEEAGVDPSRADPDGWTPLMSAADGGKADVLEYLLGRPGVDIEALADDGESAINCACCRGYVGVVRLLVAAGARVEPWSSDAPWPLGSAAMEGQLQVVKYLVEEAGADVQHADDDGGTLLMRAATKGHADVVEYLLGRSGVDIDAQTTGGKRAINYACSRGYLEVVKLLVGAGSRIYAEASDELGILSSTAAAGKLEVVKYLVEEAGVDPGRADPDGWTPLMSAADGGKADVLEYLLGRPGVDVDALTDNGQSAINCACCRGYVGVVRLLVAAGVRVEPWSSDAPWPLGSAAMEGQLEVVKYLVEEAGADAQHTDDDGWTLLICAVDHGRADVVEYLLGRQIIDIDAKSDQETALDIACRMGHLGIVKLLVGAGARVDPQAGDEKWALVSAVCGGSLEVVKYLVEEAGADAQHADPDGWTPLKWALQEGHAGVVEYLRQIESRREQEDRRAAEERAAAAAAALLEEEDREAAAKEARAKKKKKKGRQRGGAAAPHTISPPPQDQASTSTLEPLQAMPAAPSSLDPEQEAAPAEREGRDEGGAVERSGASVAQASPGHLVPAQDLHDGPQGLRGTSEETVASMVAHGHIASTEDQEEEDGLVEVIVTRDELSCPISLKLMTDPVVADDGHTYQRDAIQAWILKCITVGRPLTSPITNAEMGSNLKPNLLVRSIVHGRSRR